MSSTSINHPQRLFPADARTREIADDLYHSVRDLPIIMISSRTGEKHQEHAVQLGVNSFLGKPFQENELLATIDRLVN